MQRPWGNGGGAGSVPGAEAGRGGGCSPSKKSRLGCMLGMGAPGLQPGCGVSWVQPGSGVLCGCSQALWDSGGTAMPRRLWGYSQAWGSYYTTGNVKGVQSGPDRGDLSRPSSAPMPPLTEVAFTRPSPPLASPV